MKKIIRNTTAGLALLLASGCSRNNISINLPPYSEINGPVAVETQNKYGDELTKTSDKREEQEKYETNKQQI